LVIFGTSLSSQLLALALTIKQQLPKDKTQKKKKHNQTKQT